MDDKTKIASLATMVAQLRTENAALVERLTATTKLAEQAAQIMDTEKKDIAAQVGQVAQEGAAAAMSTTAAETISAEAVDALVEAVTKLDPSAGSELADKVIEAEGEKEGLTGEKMASLVAPIITKIAAKNRGGSMGTVKPLDKKASASGGQLMSGTDLMDTKLAELNAKLNNRH